MKEKILETNKYPETIEVSNQNTQIKCPSQQALTNFAIKLIELKNILESRGKKNVRIA